MKRAAAHCAVLLAGLSAASCASKPPDIAPILDIAARDCPKAASLAVAMPVAATQAGDSTKPITAMIDEKAPCLAGDDGKALYALFRLPDGGPFTVSLASLTLGRSLFAPRADMLDDQGAEVRQLPPSSFMFRGTDMTVLFRSHAGERYLLVRSDVKSAGKPLSRVSGSVQQTALPVGYGAIYIYTGSETATDTTWSLNGEVRVSAVADKPGS